MDFEKLVPACHLPILQTGARQQAAHQIAECYRLPTVSFCGCFVDVEGVPEWARKIARHEDARFLNEAPVPMLTGQVDFSILENGAGKCSLPFRIASRFDARCLRGSQNYSNCTACSLDWNVLNTLLAIIIALRGQPLRFADSYGTAVTYADRGHGGAGMALSSAAWSAANHGSNRRGVYLDGKYDFRDEDDDEGYGNRWGRSGPAADLVAETSKYPVTKVGRLPHLDKLELRKLLYNLVMIHHGGVLTGTQHGYPLCALTGCGAHAQATLGFDDRQETKRRLGLPDDEYVVFNWQTWGDHYTISGWPEDLWGRYLPGCWPIRASDAVRICNQTSYGYYSIDGPKSLDLDWSRIIVND